LLHELLFYGGNLCAVELVSALDLDVDFESAAVYVWPHGADTETWLGRRTATWQTPTQRALDWFDLLGQPVVTLLLVCGVIVELWSKSGTEVDAAIHHLPTTKS